MHDDLSPFLRGIFLSPHDSLLRMMYADALEEAGDARAAFVRAENALFELYSGFQFSPERYAALAAQLEELRDGIDRRWMAVIDRAKSPTCFWIEDASPRRSPSPHVVHILDHTQTVSEAGGYPTKEHVANCRFRQEAGPCGFRFGTGPNGQSVRLGSVTLTLRLEVPLCEPCIEAIDQTA